MILCSGQLFAQLQVSTVRGRILGTKGELLSGAAVMLLDPLGEVILSTISNAQGEFLLPAVPLGDYRMRASAGELHSLTYRVTVERSLPLEIEIRLRAGPVEQVVISVESEMSSVASRVTLSGKSVQRNSGRIGFRGLQAAVATAPGWATEDNGLLHVRGVDDGFLFIQDGLPVYDRLDSFFSFAQDPSSLGSVHVLTGYIPPEYGLKSGAVVEVRSERAARDSWLGTLEIGTGGDATNGLSGLASGPIGKNLTAVLNFSGEGSSRFLDPIHPDNFHNKGRIVAAGGQLVWSASTRDSLTASVGFGHSDFQVPHGVTQHAAGQDQQQDVRQSSQSFSWQRFWTSRTVSQVAGYSRDTRAILHAGPHDTPLLAESSRKQQRTVFLANVTHQMSGHSLKAGIEASRLALREFFTFEVVDVEEAEEAGLSPKALEFIRGNPFVFRDAVARPLWSFYLQDTFQAVKNLNFDLGFRFDRTRLLKSEQQWSPRLGASYLFARSRTRLRASWNRFFQPPQPEYLLLSSSRQARALSPFVSDSSEGGAELSAERQSAREVGLEQWLAGSIRLDMSYWRRQVRNYADPNIFFGTTLVFPNTVDRGEAAGLDLRLEIPERRGWSGYASYSNARVQQFGPINGGLFLEDDILEIGPGTPFTPDHDQRNVGSAGITYDHVRSGIWFSITGRHESGTPLQVEDKDLDELLELPGSHLVNFARGRVRPRTLWNVAAGKSVLRSDHMDLSARVEVWNLTNRAYAFNFGNPFSGTHFGAPRTLALKLRLDFR
jgi:hypothetical protein